MSSSNSLKISSMSHELKGVSRLDNGKAIFIEDTIVDEVVTYKELKVKKDFVEAKAESITEPSKYRVEPICKHFGVCGGCAAQHIDSQYQLELKQKVVIEQINRIGKITEYQLMPAIVGPNINYRNKARLGVKFVVKKDKVLVGFRERNKGYLADISECKIMHKKIADNLIEIQEMLYKISIKQHIAQIEVAIGDFDVAFVIRNLKPLPDGDAIILQEFAEEKEIIIYMQPKGIDSIYQLWPKEPIEYLNYSIKAFNLTFCFKATDFTQINPLMNEKMVLQAIDWLELKSDDVVLDLFCGIGNFTLPIAKFVNKVVGVEGSSTAIDRARFNCEKNNITNSEFYVANLMEDCNGAQWLNNTYNKILLDPPRSGAKDILEKIGLINPEEVLYVSCNSSTLARDAEFLVHKYGYKLIKLGVMDMFPHTTHVEVMALFRKS